MAVKLLFQGIPQFEDSSGNPYTSARLFFYAAGSSTKQNTYSDSAGSTANDNPITLNSSGYPAVSGNIVQIWGTTGQSYKIGLAAPGSDDPPASFIWTSDNVTPINDTSVSVDEWVSGPTPTYVSATSFTLVGDQTSTFMEGRRLKVTDSGGTKYCTITGSSFGATTTVTVAGDALASPTSAVSYSLMSATNPSISSEMIYRKGTAVASAATCDIWNTQGDFVHVTGNTGPITSFGTAPYTGAEKTVIFDSTPTITYNATTLLLPGAANITAAANDRMVIRADTTSNMVVTLYTRTGIAPLTATQTANTVYAGPSSGAAAAPAFRALVGADGASMVLLQATSASGASSVDFTTGISSTYDRYLLVMTQVIPGTDNTDLYIRYSTDGGSNYPSTNEYTHARQSCDSAGTLSGAGASGAGQILIKGGLGSSTNEQLSGDVWLGNLSSATKYKGLWHQGQNFDSAGAFNSHIGWGQFITSSAINAIRVIMSSGTITGEFALYGFKKA